MYMKSILCAGEETGDDGQALLMRLIQCNIFRNNDLRCGIDGLPQAGLPRINRLATTSPVEIPSNMTEFLAYNLATPSIYDWTNCPISWLDPCHLPV